jgi:hypothetical protein
MAHLRSSRDLRLIERDDPSAPDAVAAGRHLADTPYFCVLDDDDEYLPNALATRRQALESDEGADVVVTSGFRNVDGADSLHPSGLEKCRHDPLGGLVETKWLLSCSGLYRSSAIGAAEFDGTPRFMEWTYLAAKLSLRHKIVFIDRPTYRCYINSPESVSQSDDYVFGAPEALRAIGRLGLPRKVAAHFQEEYVAALNQASNRALRTRRRREAWQFHLRSLGCRGGLIYLPYTRHLLRP